jgi:hypothetical protein
MKYVVNAATDDMAVGEIVEIDPRLFADYIEAKVLSPIDDYGNRLTEDGEILILSSTTEEQRRAREREAADAYDADHTNVPGDPDADFVE